MLQKFNKFSDPAKILNRQTVLSANWKFNCLYYVFLQISLNILNLFDLWVNLKTSIIIIHKSNRECKLYMTCNVQGEIRVYISGLFLEFIDVQQRFQVVSCWIKRQDGKKTNKQIVDFCAKHCYLNVRIYLNRKARSSERCTRARPSHRDNRQDARVAIRGLETAVKVDCTVTSVRDMKYLYTIVTITTSHVTANGSYDDYIYFRKEGERKQSFGADD